MSKAITAMAGSALAAAVIVATAFVAVTEASTRVEAGVLTCTAKSSTGFIVGSTRELSCRFRRDGKDEYYVGTIQKFGLDIGSTQQTRLVWAVLAPTRALPPRSLAGSYAGVSAEATVGYGVGANALIGGSSKSIVLQPLSVQAQKGLNIAAGVAGLTLRPVR